MRLHTNRDEETLGRMCNSRPIPLKELQRMHSFDLPTIQLKKTITPMLATVYCVLAHLSGRIGTLRATSKFGD